MKQSVQVLGCALAALLLFGGCGGDANRYVPPPPPEVTVSQPVEQEVTPYAEYTGNTVAVASVDLRARVKGFLRSYSFKASEVVKKDTLLFVIEPEPYQAQVDQAKGKLEAAQANYKGAVEALAIKEEMYSKNAASKLDVINATNQRDLAKAQIDMAQADLESAQINLGYTHIYAPFTGQINRWLVDPGNLVGAGEETLLANIVQQDPMYAYFNVSERDLLEHMARQRSVQSGDRRHQMRVYLGLATEEGYPHGGNIDYADNHLDPDSGTIQLRGVFPNPDGMLMPGLFVRIRIPGIPHKAMLVPDVALGADQSGRFLLVVNEKNIVEFRRVRMGDLYDAMRVVEGDVKPSDWVVVKGLLKARPGSEVKPQREKLTPPVTTPTPANPPGK